MFQYFLVLEAIMGQFYLAILIASLVGRNIAQQSDETPPSET